MAAFLNSASHREVVPCVRQVRRIQRRGKAVKFIRKILNRRERQRGIAPRVVSGQVIVAQLNRFALCRAGLYGGSRAFVQHSAVDSAALTSRLGIAAILAGFYIRRRQCAAHRVCRRF